MIKLNISDEGFGRDCIDTAPKVIRNNSQAKGPFLDDTLESEMTPTKQLYVEESFR